MAPKSTTASFVPPQARLWTACPFCVYARSMDQEVAGSFEEGNP